MKVIECLREGEIMPGGRTEFDRDNNATGKGALNKRMNNRVKGLDLGIPIMDLEKSVKWYEKYLGCELIGLITGTAALRLTPHQVITLFSPEGEKPGSYWYPGEDYKENSHNVITLEVEDFEGFFNILNNAGVQVGEIMGENSSCGRTFEFYDLEGNRFHAWEGYVTKSLL
jgi:predicted enzyme related to lactoylglutathione lyase